MITRDFLSQQKAQNTIHSEISYTLYTHFVQKNLSADGQITALEKARQWAEEELGIYCNFIFDISKEKKGGNVNF